MQRFRCLCMAPESVEQPSRRGFLSGLGALGASAALSGCQGMAASATAGKPHRIDVHHHIMPPAYVEQAVKLGQPKPPPWSVQRSLDEMDKNGIATSVVALMQPGAYFENVELDRKLARESNEFAAKMAADHPGRFGSFATLPLMDVEGSLREIAYAFDTLRADGIGLMTSYGTTYLGDPRFAPIWTELNRRKAVIYTHPLSPACCRNPIAGLPPSALEFATDTSRTIASLLFTGTAARYPDIRWIFSHSGGTMPMLWSRYTRQQTDIGETRAKAAMPNGVLHEIRKFYYDTAQGNHAGAMAALREIVPVSQILYGTDYPYRTAGEAVDALGARSFGGTERMAVDRANALRILPGLKTV
ncbi:MAG: amidohydrolase family protein [Burkholderiales bacterium]